MENITVISDTLFLIKKYEVRVKGLDTYELRLDTSSRGPLTMPEELEERALKVFKNDMVNTINNIYDWFRDGEFANFYAFLESLGVVEKNLDVYLFEGYRCNKVILTKNGNFALIDEDFAHEIMALYEEYKNKVESYDNIDISQCDEQSIISSITDMQKWIQDKEFSFIKDPSRREYLEKIHEQVSKIGQVIDYLLNWKSTHESRWLLYVIHMIETFESDKLPKEHKSPVVVVTESTESNDEIVRKNLSILENTNDKYFVSTFTKEGKPAGEIWFSCLNLSVAILTGREMRKLIDADWVRTEEVSEKDFEETENKDSTILKTIN